MKAWTPPGDLEGYRLVRVLGAGAMGEVYLAHDTLLDRPVAIKFVSDARLTENARQRFLIEARAAARIQHPNVIAVYRVGEVDGRPFLVTEYVAGESLDRTPKPLAAEELLAVGLDLARGLAAAHRSGVLHRDIKPGNAMRSEAGAKLADFGLAKLLDEVVAAPLAPPPPAPRPAPPPPAPPRARRVTGPSDRTLDEDQPALAKALHTQDDPAASLDTSDASGASPAAGLTQAGAILGTPLYMAPEIWRAEAATRRSDVYSLGAMMFELATGRTPHRAKGLTELGFKVCNEDAPSLATIAPTVSADLAAIVDRCLARDPDQRYGSGDEVREQLERLRRHGRDARLPEGNPYRGLRAFQAEDSAVFFGRDSETRAVVERLRTAPLVVVAGDSGAGKSSLCRAGVIPAVADGALAGARSWAVLTAVPGRHPVAALLDVLGGLPGLGRGRLEELLAGDGPLGVARAVLTALGPTHGVLLLLDQMEELVTLAPPAEAETAAALLVELASGAAATRVLCTVRSDLLGRVAHLPALREALAAGLVLLGPLGREGLRDAIVLPARAKGVRFEPDELADRLVASAASHGGLPLLQFALAEVWEARDRERGAITAGALDRIGGVEGALARHADGLLGSLPARERAQTRWLLTRLVTSEGTRARRLESELLGADEPEARRALDALVTGRLVVALDTSEGRAFELAHEALVHGWETLAAWLRDGADQRAREERLARAAAEWDRLGRPPDALLGRRQLAEQVRADEPSLPARERAYLGASRAAARRARLLRFASVAAVPALVLAAVLTTQLRARAERRRTVATYLAEADREGQRAASLDQHLEQLRARALAAFDDRKPEAEGLWTEHLSGIPERERAYAQAGQALELALSHDPTRSELRGRLADLLLRRIDLAERDDRREARDELRTRLTLFDDGTRQARLSARGRIVLRTDPVAELSLSRYVATRGRPYELVAAAFAPGHALDPGSYLFTVRAAGRIDVRYPALVRPGEATEVSIYLPRPAEVPEGFLYVPEGRFQLGTLDESNRVFNQTCPRHERSTGSFLIGRTEVTYRQWIAFLRDLPAAERAGYLAKGTSAAMHGEGTLVERAGVFSLLLARGDALLRAREGEPMRLPGRKHRAAQEWLQFPVVGTSAPDAEAFARWLDRTGRVPGARLCTELEWERAARGADQRDYPHGDVIAPEHANHAPTYDRDPVAVGPDEAGTYPVSTSPFGLSDMAGNAYEWTTAILGKHTHALRGAGYFQEPVQCRVYNRETPDPRVRDNTVGFRICADFRRR